MRILHVEDGRTDHLPVDVVGELALKGHAIRGVDVYVTSATWKTLKHRVRVKGEFPEDDDGPDLDSMGRIKVKRKNNVTKLQERIAELEARLEITHAYRCIGDTGEVERFELSEDQKRQYPDGISCRDASIYLLEESNKKLVAKVKELKARLGE